MPNLRVALLSGMFLTFAIVMGEFTFASLLSWPAFGPYIEEIGSMRAYTPQAVSVMSFADHLAFDRRHPVAGPRARGPGPDRRRTLIQRG